MQLAGFTVDGVDAEEISAQVGAHDEGAGRIQKDLVRMRGVLLSNGTRASQFEVEFLERGIAVVQRKSKGRNRRALATDDVSLF